MLGIGNSPLLRERLCLFGKKNCRAREKKRERERERGAIETKVITPGKIVPQKCCLLGLNVGVKKDFDTDISLTNTHFQVLWSFERLEPTSDQWLI